MSKNKYIETPVSFSCDLDDFEVPECNKDFIEWINKDTMIQVLNHMSPLCGLNEDDKGID